MTKILTELTSEQIVLFSSFAEKWRLIALSTEPIDRQKAVKSVGAAYELIGKKQPEVIFFRSPYEAILEISALADSQQDFVRAREISLYKLVLEILSAWGRNAMPRVSWRRFLSQAYQQINHARELLIYELLTRCNSQMGIGWRELNKGAKLIDGLSPELYFYPDVVAYDFSITIHKDNPQPWEWSVFRDLITDCGWIFAFKGVCFVCVRVACRRRIAPAFFPLIVKIDSTQKENLPFNLPMGLLSTPITEYLYQKSMENSILLNGILNGYY